MIDQQLDTMRVQFPLDKDSYDESCMLYERMTDHKLWDSDTIVIGGYGFSMKVEHLALVLKSERVTTEEKIVKLYCGAHKIRQIIILSDGGFITIGAIQWCIGQDITVILLDWKGSLIQVLAPKHPSCAMLICQQYRARQSPDTCVGIACELVRRKVQSQVEVLKTFPERKSIAIVPKVHDKKTLLENGQGRLLRSSICQFLSDSLDELSCMKTVGAIQMYESNLARVYWDAFMEVPIRWDKKVAKIVPPHWLSISGRRSMLSQNGQHAINPFHAALNFAYALLEGQVLRSVMAAGLEPTCGYLHANQDDCVNSLAHDLMEPFRATVDAKVFSLFNKTTFNRGDFYQVFSGECRMNEEMRRYILATCRAPQKDIDDTVQWLKATIQKVP